MRSRPIPFGEGAYAVLVDDGAEVSERHPGQLYSVVKSGVVWVMFRPDESTGPNTSVLVANKYARSPEAVIMLEGEPAIVNPVNTWICKGETVTVNWSLDAMA